LVCVELGADPQGILPMNQRSSTEPDRGSGLKARLVDFRSESEPLRSLVGENRPGQDPTVTKIREKRNAYNGI